MKIETLKNPASIVGAFILIFIGGYIAGATQMSIGNKDGSPAKEISAPIRITMGVIVLLIGATILFTHFKKQE
jgi:uncharacterized membrane protein